MAKPEEADPEPAVNELLERLGHVWPATDSQLDAWLKENPLPAEEAAWVRDVVRRRIQEAQGVAPVARPAEPAPPAPRPRKALRARGRLSYDDLATLNAELVELVEAKVPLPAGLATFSAELRSGGLGGVLRDLKADLETGLPLSEAMARRGSALPPIYQALVRAGEESGDLASALAILAEQAQVDAEISRRAREALAYPGATLFAVVAGITMVFVWVAPRFQAILSAMEVELPWVTVFVLDASLWVRDSFPAIAIASLALATAAWFGFIRGGAKFARVFAFRGTRNRRIAELARALAGFLRRGVPADRAFAALAEAYQESFPSGALERVRDSLEAGTSLSAALRAERKAFPGTFVWLVGTAEERGTLPETLVDVASQYERAYKSRLKLIEALVAPIGLFTVGMVLGTLVLALFLPIFKLQQALTQ